MTAVVPNKLHFTLTCHKRSGYLPASRFIRLMCIEALDSATKSVSNDAVRHQNSISEKWTAISLSLQILLRSLFSADASLPLEFWCVWTTSRGSMELVTVTYCGCRDFCTLNWSQDLVLFRKLHELRRLVVLRYSPSCFASSISSFTIVTVQWLRGRRGQLSSSNAVLTHAIWQHFCQFSFNATK